MKLLFCFLTLCFFLQGEAAHADETYEVASPASTRQNNNGEQAVEQISKDLEEYNKQAEQVLNQADKVVGVSTPDPALNVLRERAMKLAGDDRFLKSAQEMWSSSKRKKMLAIQAGVFLFLIILKAWRQSLVKNWFRRLLMGFAFTIATVVIVSYVIPLAMLGEPFAIFTGTLWRVLVVGA